MYDDVCVCCLAAADWLDYLRTRVRLLCTSYCISGCYLTTLQIMFFIHIDSLTGVF